jgi:hypothetical protein
MRLPGQADVSDFSRGAIVPSVARIVTEANHQILSNWLKRATRKRLTHCSRNLDGHSPLTPGKEGNELLALVTFNS